MYIEKDKFISSFTEIESALAGYSLPSWDVLPDIELYMDQVISLVTKYLEVYDNVMGLHKLVTPSMINNYVKLGIIPAPIKKKYSKLPLLQIFLFFIT